MKVLLIQSLSKNFRPIFPAGLARIGSVIEDQHRIEVFDPNIEPKIKDTLIEKLEEFNPDVVGISLRCVDSIDYIGREYFYPDFVKFLKYIRRVKPKTKIVVGGGGFSLFAAEIMQDNPEIDAGVLLEGEEAFPELLENLDNFRQVKGLFVRNGNAIHFTGKRNPVGFKNLPLPAYKYFDLQKYISRGVGIGIESKRGCRLKCSYCPYPYLTGQNLRMRTPKAVVDEIEFLVSNYGIREFAFIDSVFNIPLEHSENICKEILARNLDIRWSCWTNEKMFTEEYARLAIKAGCVNFPFSTDGFSDKSLELLGKNYTNKDILKTVEVADKLDNISIGYGFFLNPPGSSVKSVFQMIWFLIKAKRTLGKKMKGGRLFLFNRIRVEPHTKMRDIAIEEGLIKPDANLLKPVYYTQGSTRYLEFIYNVITWPLGVLVKFQRLIRHGGRRKLNL